jgi:hypothetical protein
MLLLILKAYVRLIHFDFLLSVGGFASVYRFVRNYPLQEGVPATGAQERVCRAVDVASIWYWKEVSCLHRSVLATCLLRGHSVRAQLVIGTQQLPFKAHAWVEAAGQVVNDKPYAAEMYCVLDRC